MVCINSVRLSPNVLTLKKGEWYHDFSVSVSPSNATCSCVKWRSSNPSVAAVGYTGSVCAMKAGVAIIYAIAEDGSQKMGNCVVRVIEDIPVESITLNMNSMHIKEGTVGVLRATVLPENAGNKAVTWSSSNTAVATVSGGCVYARSQGIAVISAKARDGSGVCAACYVHVKANQCVDSVTVFPAAKTMAVGESGMLTATVCPTTACANLTWSSSDSDIVSVNPSNGLIVANRSGTATITAHAQDGSGETDSCQVFVRSSILVEDITLSRCCLTMNTGNTACLCATVSPVNATAPTLRWTSSNPQVVTVVNGTVYANAKGSAVVSVSSTDGSQKTKTCVVNVTGDVLVTKISIPSASLCMEVGESVSLNASVTPENATCSSVQWESSDPSVASVHPSNGLVIAHATGATNITATALDGSDVRDVCTVYVHKLIETITVGLQTNEVAKSQVTTAYAMISPSDASNKNLSWYSEDESIASVTDPKRRLVTAHKEGTVNICAKAQDGSEVVGCCQLTVTDVVMVQSICFDYESCTLRPNDKFRPKVRFDPLKTTDRSLSWHSSNTDVATVDSSGMVTTLAEGTTTITATAMVTENNMVVSTSFELTVEEKKQQVSVEKDGDYFTVTFKDGPVWKSVGWDLHEPTYIEDWDRYNFNKTQTYSVKQLAFLFLFDPLGVKYYLEDYGGDHSSNIYKWLVFKDDIYTELFGTRPKLFIKHSDGTLRYFSYRTDEDFRMSVYSEAEALFGVHDIPDTWALWEFIGDVLWCAFSIAMAYISPTIYEDILLTSYAIEFLTTIFYSAAITDAFTVASDHSSDFLSAVFEEYQNGFGEKTSPKVLAWCESLFSLLCSTVEYLTPPNVSDMIVYNKVIEFNFETSFVLDDNSTMTMEEVIEHCLPNDEYM